MAGERSSSGGRSRRRSRSRPRGGGSSRRGSVGSGGGNANATPRASSRTSSPSRRSLSRSRSRSQRMPSSPSRRSLSRSRSRSRSSKRYHQLDDDDSVLAGIISTEVIVPAPGSAHTCTPRRGAASLAALPDGGTTGSSSTCEGSIRTITSANTSTVDRRAAARADTGTRGAARTNARSNSRAGSFTGSHVAGSHIGSVNESIYSTDSAVRAITASWDARDDSLDDASFVVKESEDAHYAQDAQDVLNSSGVSNATSNGGALNASGASGATSRSGGAALSSISAASSASGVSARTKKRLLQRLSLRKKDKAPPREPKEDANGSVDQQQPPPDAGAAGAKEGGGGTTGGAATRGRSRFAARSRSRSKSREAGSPQERGPPGTPGRGMSPSPSNVGATNKGGKKNGKKKSFAAMASGFTGGLNRSRDSSVRSGRDNEMLQQQQQQASQGLRQSQQKGSEQKQKGTKQQRRGRSRTRRGSFGGGEDKSVKSIKSNKSMSSNKSNKSNKSSKSNKASNKSNKSRGLSLPRSLSRSKSRDRSTLRGRSRSRSLLRSGGSIRSRGLTRGRFSNSSFFRSLSRGRSRSNSSRRSLQFANNGDDDGNHGVNRSVRISVEDYGHDGGAVPFIGRCGGAGCGGTAKQGGLSGTISGLVGACGSGSGRTRSVGGVGGGSSNVDANGDGGVKDMLCRLFGADGNLNPCKLIPQCGATIDDIVENAMNGKSDSTIAAPNATVPDYLNGTPSRSRSGRFGNGAKDSPTTVAVNDLDQFASSGGDGEVPDWLDGQEMNAVDGTSARSSPGGRSRSRGGTTERGRGKSAGSGAGRKMLRSLSIGREKEKEEKSRIM